jgi:hypothetical protein
MKLLIKDNKIIATATDDYTGSEETITAPDNFDSSLTYVIVDGVPVVQGVQVITMRQARLALLDAGLLDDVEAAITTPEHKIWWDYSTTVERKHPLVNAVLTALGKTETEIDELFISASQL